MEPAAIRTIGEQFHTRIKARRRLSASRSSYNSQPQTQPQPRTKEDHMVMIKLNFSYKKITRDWLLQEDVDSPSEIIEEEDPSSARFGTLCLSRQQLFNDSESVRQAIKNELQNWPVLAPHNFNDLSEKVMRKATVKAQSSRRYDILDMYVVFTEVYYRTLRVVNYDEEEEVEDEDDSMCMVPVDPSIQSLKRKRTDDCDQRNESCSVCLDDLSFSSGSDQDRALGCMPCSHVFHADCIRKWLKISHSCPLCRYEMPTN